jgi:hypothetical protein
MRFGKLYAGVGAGAVGVVAVGAWFAFLSPQDSEISALASESSLAVGHEVTISGSIAPAVADRVVVLEQHSSGTWTETDRSATDALGEYVFTVPMTAQGAGEWRTRVLDAGRPSEATSTPLAVNVLEPTRVDAKVTRYARTDRPLRISGRVAPAEARAVILEASSDGESWTEVGKATSRGESGKFLVTAKGLEPGTIHVRVRIEESETSAAALGRAARVSVEDYKAAGKRYLAIVKHANSLIEQLNGMSDSLDYTAYQGLHAELSKVQSAQAKAFRQYAYWPREVQANIALLAQSDDLWADTNSQLANADSADEYYGIPYPRGPKGADNAAALVRAALGLPKRT